MEYRVVVRPHTARSRTGARVRRPHGTPKRSPNIRVCALPVSAWQAKAWHREARSVVLLSHGPHAICSGVLLNNTEADRTPYILTCFHAALFIWPHDEIRVHWRFDGGSCGAPLDKRGIVQQGVQIVSRFPRGDVLLLRLNDAPPRAARPFWSGWDRRCTPPRAAVTMHHPAGCAKRISIENDPLGISHTRSGHLRFIVKGWDWGSTQGTSSGAGLWNQKHRVVGHEIGGYTCSSPTWFGSIHADWTGGGKPENSLQAWLAPGLAHPPPYIDGMASP